MELTRTRWAMVLLLWVTGLLAAAQFAKITLTLEGLAALYPGAPVAWVVSGTSVMGVLAGAAAGFLVARIGVRAAVLWGVGLSAAVSAVQGVALPFWALMVSRVVEGGGHLLLVVALPTLIAALAAPRDKSVVMGLWGTFFGVSYAALAVVIPWIEGVGGVRGVYLAHGAAMLALWPVLWALVPRVMAARSAMPGLLALHRTLYTTPRYFAPALGHGLYAALFIALVAFLPAALGAPWLAAALPIANLSGTFASGVIARAIPASRLSILGFGAGALAFGLMALLASPALALLAMVMTGLTAGANFAAVPELNAQAKDQARANGAMAQIGNMGTGGGTPLFAVAAAGGLWGVAGLAMAICLLAVVFAGWTYRAARLSAELQ